MNNDDRALYAVLNRHRGTVLTMARLCELTGAEPRAVHNRLRRLRAALADECNDELLTINNRGYLLKSKGAILCLPPPKAQQ